MKSVINRFLQSREPGKSYLRVLVALAVIFCVGNLNALIDRVLHPEIPYFDEEHLIVGGIFMSLAAVAFVVLSLYTRILRNSAEEWRTTFDAISDGVSIHDNELNIVRANKAVGRFFGRPSEELIGQKCYRVFHNADGHIDDCPLKKALHSGKPESAEFLETYLGRWLSVSCFPMFDAKGEKITGTVHVARDITERRQIEEEIEGLNDELKWKIEERTKELLAAQEELVRNEKLAVLGQLASSVGHELRNPLGVISNAVYYLKTVIPGADETVREYLNIISNEIGNSEHIISDLLDFSRTKTARARPVTVTDLINQSLMKCDVPESVTVSIDLPGTLPRVNVDPSQMVQVFQNLITNAVQAMPNGGELRISAKAGVRDRGLGVGKAGVGDLGLGVSEKEPIPDPQSPPPDGNFIEISVSDTGEGISPENMGKLFQPLFSTKARGIGLGLPVSKKLVEANGGKIEVTSEAGKVTTFTVTLPVEDRAK